KTATIPGGSAESKSCLHVLYVGKILNHLASRLLAANIEKMMCGMEGWKSNPYFLSASVHQSLDGVRTFTYSQWEPRCDHRSLARPNIFGDFFRLTLCN
ncbi:MAG: hypothetical protein AAGH78_08415, partial [Cyanobacteria bacterium P01_H01_bin.58]